MIHLSATAHPRYARYLTALSLLATAGAAQGQTPASFAPVSTYSAGVGSGPWGVAVADLNGDGRPDLVTANRVSNTAGVLLGQAGGGFAAVSTYPTGTGSDPLNMAVSDVNGDGRPDIIMTNNSSSTVGVLLGLAGGAFGTASTYPTGAGSFPRGMAVADLNGDGRPDLVTANQGTGTAGVLLGLAGGGFGAVTVYPTGPNSSPYAVAVADMNGDGRLDIVTANFGNGTVGVLPGQASGGFGAVTTYFTGSSTYTVAVADVNGDGRPDIVVANAASSTVGVLLGQAGGGFAAASTYSIGANSGSSGIAVADLNGDGRPDIITANYSTSTVGMLLGMPGGGFATVSSYPTGGNQPFGVAAADVNGDGRPDIVVANISSNTVGVLLNTGTFMPLAAAPGTTAAEVSLFPNPARGGFAVQLPAAWGAAPARAELLNALGQTVREQAAILPAGGALAFATAGLAPGVYVLHLQAGDHALAKRVVVE